MPKQIISYKAEQFTESVIREMTRQANLYGAINLSQGFPDFSAPEEIKLAACDAIMADVNQYAITWGARNFRNAIAEKSSWYLGMEVDPERKEFATKLYQGLAAASLNVGRLLVVRQLVLVPEPEPKRMDPYVQCHDCIARDRCETERRCARG